MNKTQPAAGDKVEILPILSRATGARTLHDDASGLTGTLMAYAVIFGSRVANVRVGLYTYQVAADRVCKAA